MNTLLRAISYIIHPLWLPVLVVGYYFMITPRHSYAPLMYSKLFATSLLTIIIPILIFFMLKNLRLANTIHLKNTKERIIPLAIQACFTLLLTIYIFKINEYNPLHYFFRGMLGSIMAALIFTLFRFRGSLHMLAIMGVLTFIIGLSIHYSINMLLLIAILCICAGATASSRLLLKAHTIPELIVGSITGVFFQLILFPMWL